MPDDDPNDFDDSASDRNRGNSLNGRENDSRGDSESDDNESDDDMDDDSGDDGKQSNKTFNDFSLLISFIVRHWWVKEPDAWAWSCTVVTFPLKSRSIDVIGSSFIIIDELASVNDFSKLEWTGR